MKIKKWIVIGLAGLALTALGYGAASWFMDKPGQAVVQGSEQTTDQSTASTDNYAVGDRLPGSSNTAPAKSAQFDPAFPELQWDDLIPANWDPMAAFKDLDLTGLQDNDPKAQQALEAMRKAWNDAPVNSKLAGQKVRIPGFAIPVEQSDKGVDELLLVPYFGACIHTPPPPANQIIHVKLKEPQPAVGSMQAYWVWGELSTRKYSSELGDAAYLITATGIQPYED